jgi:hypothetical protein
MYELINPETRLSYNAWANYRFDDNSEKWITWQLGILGAVSFVKQRMNERQLTDISWEESAQLMHTFLDDMKPCCRVTVEHRDYEKRDGTTATAVDVKVEELLPELNAVGIPNYANQSSDSAPSFDSNEEIPF